MDNKKKLIASIDDVEMNNEEILSLIRSKPLFGHLAFIHEGIPKTTVLPYVFRAGVIYLPKKKFLLKYKLADGVTVSFSIADLFTINQFDSCIASVVCNGKIASVSNQEQSEALKLFEEKYGSTDFIGVDTGVFAVACEKIKGYLQLDERL